jgi:dihydrofolate reductase
MSLDGYVSGPTDEGEIFAAVADFTDSERYNMALLDHVDVALLGRRSYESFVQVWPTSEDEPMAEPVNNMTKVVCSTTLEEAPWGRYAPARIVRDAATYVRDVQSTAGCDLLIWGSINLMRSLLRERLVDELDIFIAPVALGTGTPLISPDGPYRLTQLEVDVWSSATHICYAIDY